MSSLIIDKFKVEKVENHFNADRLDCVTISGWQLVTQKGKYKVGDECIHIPIQTILSEEFNAKLFPPDSKIQLQSDRRIRTIKLRGAISQGMLVSPSEFDLEYVRANCTKWQPPEESKPRHMQVNMPKKAKPEIKSFIKYTDMEHGKYYDRCLQDGEQVVATCKLHGTSARYGWHKTEANTWYLKVLKFFKVLKEDTFCYGSRNVQLQFRLNKKTWYDLDVYGKIAKQEDLINKIPKGYAVYGEIVGDGIQKGYSYGCEQGQHKFYAYDVRDTNTGKWLDHEEAVVFCGMTGIEMVPVMYEGPWNSSVVPSVIKINPLSDEINEGVVVKPIKERMGPMGRFISDDYYLRQEETGGSDFQ
jgi:RNA ligase (TIGR02306 family)